MCSFTGNILIHLHSVILISLGVCIKKTPLVLKVKAWDTTDRWVGWLGIPHQSFNL